MHCQTSPTVWEWEGDNKRTEAPEMRFLRPLLGVSLGNRMRGKRLGTERMVEEIQEYQRKWPRRVESMLPERLPWQAYFYRPAGRRGTLDVQEEDGHNSSFSLRTGHGSTIELTEGEGVR
jgi:hypothetical protein